MLLVCRSLSKQSVGRTGVITLFAVVATTSLIGCGGDAPLPPMVPVKGQVTVDDQPVSSGQISLIPVVVDPSKPVPPSSGQIKDGGQYEIFTGGKSGAPEGKYKVMVTPSMVPQPGAKGPPTAPFSKKYTDSRNTPLEIEVVATPKAYDLKLSK